VHTARIALANVAPGRTREDALATALRTVALAGTEGALVACFPECYIPGYRMPGSTLPPPDQEFLERAWSAVADAAAKAKVTVVLGTERVVDGKARLTALVIDADGTRAGFQDKVQLDPSEDPSYVAGNERHVFSAGPLTFGIAICHEGWRYPETVRWAARRGAQVVFHPHYHWPEAGAFQPETFGDPRNTFHEKAMLCRAAENTVYFASVNAAIAGSPTTSAVVRPDGTVLSWQPYGEEGLLVADVDLDAATGLLASRCRYVS